MKKTKKGPKKILCSNNLEERQISICMGHFRCDIES